MMRFARLVHRDTRAAAASEMALSLPMMMALIFGGFEGGNYLLTEHKVITAAREGARYAARLPFEYFEGCGPGLVNPTDTGGNAIAGWPTAAEREAEISAVTRTGILGGTNPRVSGWLGDAGGEITITVDCDATTTAGLYDKFATTGGAPRVQVSAVVAYPSILGLLGFDTTGAVVRGQSQAAVMGI